MSIECCECERDMRGPHSAECSRAECTHLYQYGGGFCGVQRRRHVGEDMIPDGHKFEYDISTANRLCEEALL